MQILISHGATRLIGIGVILGLYLLYLLIRAIVNYASNKKYEKAHYAPQPNPYGVVPTKVPTAMWVVVVFAFLGSLLFFAIGVACIVQSIIDYHGFQIDTFLIGLLLIGVGIGLLFIGLGLRKLKKWAGIWAIVILSLLCAICFIFLIAAIVGDSKVIAFFLPIVIFAPLLWIVIANKKYMQ